MRYLTLLSLALLAGAPGSAAAQGKPAATGFTVYEATISELQSGMTRGAVTSVQLVDAYLARIRAYDQQGPAINAIIRLNPKARDEAAALDGERRSKGSRGPLHGIPVILKDNYDTQDLPTSAGSVALASDVPAEDAFVVRRLREAGAVILGKANLHELAMGITTISSLGGQTRNAYDPRRCPGGSSGGTGAAIAASFAAVGWGTDTCGSIRYPAAFGSLFGLRPTEGLVSRSGIVPLSHTQDTGGPLARTAADLAIALDATVGPDPLDTVTRRWGDRPLPRFVDALKPDALRGARLGVLRNYFADMDNDVGAVVRAAFDSLKAKGGAVTVDVTLPDFDSLLVGSRAVDLETKFDLLDYLARNPAAPVHSLSDIVARGLYHASLDGRLRRIDTLRSRDSDEHRAVLAKQALIRGRLTRLLDSLNLDALVYPTMRQKPVPVGGAQSGGTCELSANSGLPALTAPAGFTSDGLPVGIELLGRSFADARLVALAYAWEQTGPRRRPPLPTPPLVDGRAPDPVGFDVSSAPADGSTASATGKFLLDPLRLELRYDVRVSGVLADRVLAVVLQRTSQDDVGPVVYRLSGPGAAAASGTLALNAGDVKALRESRYLLTVLTTDHPAGATRGRIVVPR